MRQRGPLQPGILTHAYEPARPRDCLRVAAAALRRVQARAALELTVRTYEAVSAARANGRRAPATGPNSELRGGAFLRRLSREAVRNAGPARSAVSKLVTNIVGTGIMPRAATGNEKLDKALNDGFAQWSRECLAGTRGGNFVTLQVLAGRSMVEGGETLTRRRTRQDRDGLFVPVQAELMEPDLLDEQKTVALDNGYIFQGVEFSPTDTPRAYWLFDAHPGQP
ncbi:phage portal protein [Azospirillum sp. TSH58]|uniref:phage portal protein n=1 Tax=Azospirillum sp. TSH58 TaxID=664962 RepID=UPI0013A59D0B|nr:phage portal protein [Azospirillum sp. TSH58]